MVRTQRQKIGLRRRIALRGQPAKIELFHFIPFQEQNNMGENDQIHLAYISLIIEIEEELIRWRILLGVLIMSHDHRSVDW